MTHEQDAGGFSWLPPGLRALRRGLQGLPLAVPGNCPVCGVREMGGMLCGACEREIVCSMRDSVPVSESGCCGGRGGQGRLYRCARCALRLSAPQPCPDCTLLPLAVSRVVAAFDYDAAGKALVGRFKQGRQFLLSRALARLMAIEVRRNEGCLASIAGYTLVPVPARKVSVRERGFSSAAELARHLAGDLGLRCRTGWLVCRDDGPRQTGQSRRRRLAPENADAYVSRGSREGSRVVLVDDVMTTGSTLHRAASALRRAGAEDVMAVVLARTPLH